MKGMKMMRGMNQEFRTLPIGYPVNLGELVILAATLTIIPRRGGLDGLSGYYPAVPHPSLS